MERRTTTFLIASMTVMLAWIFLVEPAFFPRPQRPQPNAPRGQEGDASEELAAQRGPQDAAAPERAAGDAAAGQAAADDKQPAQPEIAAQPPDEKPRRPEPNLQNNLVLGSLEADSQFNMRVLLTNRGAAIRRIELADYLREGRAGALQLIDPDISPDEDSFLLSLGEVIHERKRLAAESLRDLNRRLTQRNWEVVPSKSNEVVFQTVLDELGGMVVTKRFALEPDTYDLSLSVAWHLPEGATPRVISYRLATANGLPLEGAWYAVSFREAVVGAANGDGTSRKSWAAATLAGMDEKDEVESWESTPIRFGGVDCQYFAVVTVPHQAQSDPWIAAGQPMLIERNRKKPEYSDVSFALSSTELSMRPGEEVSHAFSIFAGPKDPDVLGAAESKIQGQMQANLGGPEAATVPDPGLDSLMNYGWFGRISAAMLWLLKFFHGIVGNWGLAILMLTVLVRLVLFPLSRKQAVASQKMQAKMQKLAPEIKQLREKYKNDLQKFNQAQWELMKKHGVNPFAQLGGCLPMLVQLPIFIGLYWGLRLAIELRQAPLIPGIGWCSDLSAPDMLWRFPAPLANFFEGWTGLFAILNLGPYLNVLPIVTVVIFLVQQKLFMPPPTDEQSAQMQKMMTWMMPLFGLLFYKVPSGLCLYFIASSLWGIAERKMKPKAKDEPPPAAAAADRRRKKKDRPLIPARGSR